MAMLCRISIHSLRMEGDYRRISADPIHHYFNPLPPHGGRRFEKCCYVVLVISIHSLRMEGDAGVSSIGIKTAVLQSTPPAWRETKSITGLFRDSHFSIPPLRMEGDSCSHRATLRNVHFNPLPPHGGRQEKRRCRNTEVLHFNPLPPHGGRL